MTPLMIDFLYVDDFIVVVNKPSGLPSQSTRDPRQTHLYEQVLDRFPNASLHHRLDTPSSGLVLLTVAPEVNRAISTAFREHSIERRYLAVLAGHPGDSGTWNQPIDGKTAVTHYKNLGSANGMSLIEATLETGRTHQIRIHASNAGHPIIGDRRHGGAARNLWPRLALHAVSLSLTHPKTTERLTVSAPIPENLAPLLEPLCSTLDHRYTPTIAAD